ncbi:MAG: PPC domain-containing protein, partial [Bdellovibrionales bacterium]|nr:PPC domain-containing protein [Bdellovibrionales bacterium]
QVSTALIEGAVLGSINRVGSKSPNLLLNTQFLNNKNDTTLPKLENGVTLTHLSGGQFAQKHFAIVVPSGTQTLDIKTTGGSGDADLYVRLNSPATEDDYNCRPFKNGNEESCSWENPAPGVYHVMINGYSSYHGLSLSAEYKLVGVITGRLTERGDTHEHQYNALSGLQKLTLEGPESADFDLSFYKKDNAGGWELLERSQGYTSQEEIEYQGTAGEYMAVVRAFSGQGEYKLSIDK